MSNLDQLDLAARAAELQSTLETMATHVADRFEQIAAMCQTLTLLLQSPALYQDPLIAMRQLAAIQHLADEAALAADAIGEETGHQRNAARERAILQARAAFIASVAPGKVLP